jgi:pyridoxamine 5'-phosphate oxidase family protein
MTLSDQELAYLRSQPLARLATIGSDGQPDVVPVAFELNCDGCWVGGTGAGVAATRNFRNIASHPNVALVIGDLVSLNPFIERSIRVYGLAEPPIERTGLVGPGQYSRITPTVSWSWNVTGEPADQTWYGARKTTHSPRC